MARSMSRATATTPRMRGPAPASQSPPPSQGGGRMAMRPYGSARSNGREAASVAGGSQSSVVSQVLDLAPAPEGEEEVAGCAHRHPRPVDQHFPSPRMSEAAACRDGETALAETATEEPVDGFEV